MKFTKEEIFKLVEARNTPEMVEQFKIAEKNAYKIKNCWERVKNNAGLFEHSTADLTKRYNDLLSKYREYLISSKKSGSGAIKWKYWTLFQQNLMVGRDLNPGITFNSTLPPESSLTQHSTPYPMHSPEKNSDSNIEIINTKPNEFTMTPKKKKVDENTEILTKFLENSNSFKTDISSTLSKLNDEYHEEILSLKGSIKDLENSFNEKFNKALEFMQTEKQKTNDLLMELLARKKEE